MRANLRHRPRTELTAAKYGCLPGDPDLVPDVPPGQDGLGFSMKGSSEDAEEPLPASHVRCDDNHEEFVGLWHHNNNTKRGSCVSDPIGSIPNSGAAQNIRRGRPDISG